MKPTARLRELLVSDPLLVAPGAYDGFTARLVEQAGFPVVYMTGAGTATEWDALRTRFQSATATTNGATT
jgi:2-methylisocitrate lyase-like PEP mutase family enzyme